MQNSLYAIFALSVLLGQHYNINQSLMLKQLLRMFFSPLVVYF